MPRTATQTWHAYLAVWNGTRPIGDLEELVADEYAGEVGSLAQDKAALAARIEVYRVAHPAAQFTVLDQFGEGDRLVTRLQVGGLTGQDHPLRGINIGRHTGGQLVQEWAVWESH